MVEHDHVEGRRRSFLIGGSSGPRLTNERLREQNDLDQRVFARGHFVSYRYCGHNNAKRVVVCLASCIRRLRHPVMDK